MTKLKFITKLVLVFIVPAIILLVRYPLISKEEDTNISVILLLAGVILLFLLKKYTSNTISKMRILTAKDNQIVVNKSVLLINLVYRLLFPIIVLVAIVYVTSKINTLITLSAESFINSIIYLRNTIIAIMSSVVLGLVLDTFMMKYDALKELDDSNEYDELKKLRK